MITYFIKNSVNGLIKIGKSTDVAVRMKALSGQWPFIKFTIFHTINGNYEKAFHDLYREYRVKGEWFNLGNITKRQLETDAIGLNELPLIDKKCTKVYHGFTHVIAKAKCVSSGKIIFWLLPHGRKPIISNSLLYKQFSVFSESNGCKPMSCREFKNGLSELAKIGALTMVQKGHYYLNPYLFWRDTKNERIKFIQDEQKEKRHLSHNPRKQINN